MANTSVLQDARPTFLVDGQNMATISDGLLGLLIVENSNGLYRCEALFGNWGSVNGGQGFLYFDRKVIDFGKSLTVKYGTDTLFDGRITALEANFLEGRPPELNVLAEDRLQDLRMTRRTRTFTDVSDADVINKIAGEHGLTPKVDVSGPQYKTLAQVNQSDLAFLRERARAIDAELWMEGKTLNAVMHTKRDGGSLSLAYGREVRAFSVLADLANQRTSVSVSGWDAAGKAALQHEATAAVLGGELNGDTSGPGILASAFGTRKESLVHTVPLTSQEAQAQAETFMKVSARRFVVGRGEVAITSQLRVGTKLELLELGPLFSGKYYVTEVRHLFSLDMHGLRTEFTVERPGLGQGQ